MIFIKNVNDDNGLLQFVENENKYEIKFINDNETEVLNENYSGQKQNFKESREKDSDGLMAQVKKIKLMSKNKFSLLTV
jgi:hypothetical protein